MLWRATVQREDPSKPHFSPNPQQAQTGDAIFWFNEDKETEHQLYPSDPPPSQPPLKAGAWGDVIGPGTPSQQVDLSAGTITYKCVFHNDESGTIVVASGCVIAAGVDISDPTTKSFFNPVSVASGGCVSWGNADANPHQPAPDEGDPWFTDPINPGDLSASIPFKQAKGTTVNYHCTLHPAEKGAVTVT